MNIPMARARLRTLLLAQALAAGCAANPYINGAWSLVDRTLTFILIGLLVWLTHSAPAYGAPGIVARRGTQLCLGCAVLLLGVRFAAAISLGPNHL
jgi:hypothetical protein